MVLCKESFQQSFALPHNENVLATLGNIHIVRGSIETVTELEAATMRTQVVLDFISKLRGSGYPGYISTVEVTLGSTLVAQFKPQYLGIAHPFTLPRAVDGYDVPGRSGWRRPDEERLKNQGPLIVPDAVFTYREAAAKSKSCHPCHRTKPSVHKSNPSSFWKGKALRHNAEPSASCRSAIP